MPKTWIIFATEDADEPIELINKYKGKGTVFKITLDSDVEEGIFKSHKQRKYQWGVVYTELLNYFANQPRKFLEYALQVGMSKEFIHEWIKLKYKVKTTEMDMKPFCELIDNIRHDAFHDLGLRIPEPNEDELMQAYEEYLKERGV